MLKYEPSTKNKGAAILTEHKKREREAAKEGKKPYYLKKCMSGVFTQKSHVWVEHNSFEFFFAKSFTELFSLFLYSGNPKANTHRKVQQSQGM